MRNYRIDLKQGQTSPPIVVGIAATFIQTVSSTLGRPVSVLDVGCGSGLIMQMIKEQTGCISSCIGIDYSPFVVEALQQKDIYNQAIFSKASVLPFQDKTFDCVLSIECLEHLYSNHVEQAKEQIGRELTLKERIELWEQLPNKDIMDFPIGPLTDEQYHTVLSSLDIPRRTREPYPLPTLKIVGYPDEYNYPHNEKLFDELEPCDLILENYQSHPTIKAPLSN